MAITDVLTSLSQGSNLNKEKEEEEAVIWKEEEEFLRIRNNSIPDFTLPCNRGH